MKTSLWVLAMLGIGLAVAGESRAAWCTTVTDNNCGDTNSGESQYTVPEDTDSITVRYDAGNADCAVDIEIWSTKTTPWTLQQAWTDKCNCGVVVFQPNVNSGHTLLFRVKCRPCSSYNGVPNPCGSSVYAKFYSPGNNISCNSACIPD